MRSETADPFLSIRAIEARTSGPSDLGHTWLHWGPQIIDNHIAYRGFYPDLGKVQPGIIPPGALERGDFEWARNYLFDHAVPGMQRVDRRALDTYERQNGSKVRHSTDSLTTIQHLKLEYRCRMPAGADWRAEGLYSFNQNSPQWDNCISWAVKRCREVRGTIDDPPLPNPARIKVFYPLLREPLAI
jgi:hypothetical protein